MKEIESSPVARSGYVVVEGPIGVGKTTLATRLAKSYDRALLLKQIATIKSGRHYFNPVV